MIYLDNAATGGFKPSSVLEIINTTLRYLSANPGRSGHRLSLTGAKLVLEARAELASFFGANEDRVVFTKNCTEALNLAIFGTLKPGKKVITTIYEHNSVLRPLYALKEHGLIELDIVAPTEKQDIYSAIKDKITNDAYLIVTTAVSNVTGYELPVQDLGELAKKHNLLYLVDGAQAGGHIPLNLKSQGISMLAVAGHKGLYGPMGSGALVFDDSVEISPFIHGGTGTESFNTSQPASYPERLEAGTLNLPAIAGLKEGVKYIRANLKAFGGYLYNATATLISELNKIHGIKCYSLPNGAGIVSFALDGKDSAEIADALSEKFDIAVRGGLHCAPLMHGHLGTQKNGLVRVSLAVQNSTNEIMYLVKCVKSLAENG